MTRKQKRNQSRARSSNTPNTPTQPKTTQPTPPNNPQPTLHHAGFGQCILLHTESAAALDRLVNDYIADHEPQNESQLKIIYRMAAATWRMQRAQGVEAVMVNQKMQEQHLDLAKRMPGTIHPTLRTGHAIFAMSEPNSPLKAIQSTADLCERQFSRALRDLERAKKMNNEPKGFRTPQLQRETPQPACASTSNEAHQPDPEPTPTPPEPEKQSTEPNTSPDKQETQQKTQHEPKQHPDPEAESRARREAEHRSIQELLQHLAATGQIQLNSPLPSPKR